MRFLSGESYSKRAVPPPQQDAKSLAGWAKTLVAWLGIEFGNAQRAIAPAGSRLMTASGSLTKSDGLVLVDATAGSVSVTLLSAADVPDSVVTVKRIDASGNTVTLVGTIDGAVNPTLAQWKSKTIWAYAPEGAASSWNTVASV